MRKWLLVISAVCLLSLLAGTANAAPQTGYNMSDPGAEPGAPAALAMWPQVFGQDLLSPVQLVSSGKWIDINISRQRITAYVGSRIIRRVLVSTGTWRHPTVTGIFRIYAKVHSQAMSGGSRVRGDYYYLPGVPHVMYFYSGYAIHGTYWHHNFGHPMSHGCVNLTLSDASWFYNWAPIGTRVYSHY
jgi:lipoprotein-anchoring transpeptidase ErfK/SrfK